MIPDSSSSQRPRVLVAIANHGTKNRVFLDRLLAAYRSMSRYDLHLVVHSNVPKDLGDDIEVKVGLPSEDPWSLPFAHKSLFAERARDFDLFIYSEDDTLLEERHIDAFLEVTPLLPEDRIAGFMRYEVDTGGRKTYSGMHSHFHWDSRSLERHGGEVFAHHTNDHAACYLLTRTQLKRAIDSGGYLLPPAKRGYGMPETAATDPYAQCGMRKVVCISRFDDFCLHHLPNAYCGKLGLAEELARQEIAKLLSLNHDVTNTRGPLFEPCALHDSDFRNKPYYEAPRRDVLAAVPEGTRSVLSVGCGCGATEGELVKRGIRVAAVPLDEVVAATAGARGIEILPPDFNASIASMEGRRFDCLLMLDILHHLSEPETILSNYRDFLETQGQLIVSVPNCLHPALFRRRGGGANVHPTHLWRTASWLRRAGFHHIRDHGIPEGRAAGLSKWTFGLAKGLLCRKLLLTAQPRGHSAK